MSKYQAKLDKLLSEELGLPPISVKQATDLVDIASQLLETIGRCKRDLQDSEIQLNNVLEQLNTSLGSEIRNIQPKLTISHKNGSCIAGYKTRDLQCRPNLANKTWSVEGPLKGPFIRSTPPAMLHLSGDVNPLANSIVNFFMDYYKSLK